MPRGKPRGATRTWAARSSKARGSRCRRCATSSARSTWGRWSHSCGRSAAGSRSWRTARNADGTRAGRRARHPAGPGSRLPPEPSRPGPKEPSLREGSRNFQRSCAACHGSDGRGGEMRDSLPSIPDFTSGTWHGRAPIPSWSSACSTARGPGCRRSGISCPASRPATWSPSSGRWAPRRGGRRRASDDFEARFQQLLTEFEDLRAEEPGALGRGGPAPRQRAGAIPAAPPR